MDKLRLTRLGVMACLGALLALPGCGERNDGRTVGQKIDSFLGRSKQAAHEVKQDTKEAVAQAEDAARNASSGAKGSVMGAGGNEQGGAQEGASGPGARLGAKLDDAKITATVKTGLLADKDLSAFKIDVTTRDGVVTLSGTAPTQAASQRAAEIAQHVRDVKSVDNRLKVQAG